MFQYVIYSCICASELSSISLRTSSMFLLPTKQMYQALYGVPTLYTCTLLFLSIQQPGLVVSFITHFLNFHVPQTHIQRQDFYLSDHSQPYVFTIFRGQPTPLRNDNLYIFCYSMNTLCTCTKSLGQSVKISWHWPLSDH